jgi:hypothetical protein
MTSRPFKDNVTKLTDTVGQFLASTEIQELVDKRRPGFTVRPLRPLRPMTIRAFLGLDYQRQLALCEGQMHLVAAIVAKGTKLEDLVRGMTVETVEYVRDVT